MRECVPTSRRGSKAIGVGRDMKIKERRVTKEGYRRQEQQDSVKREGSERDASTGFGKGREGGDGVVESKVSRREDSGDVIPYMPREVLAAAENRVALNVRMGAEQGSCFTLKTMVERRGLDLRSCPPGYLNRVCSWHPCSLGEK